MIDALKPCPFCGEARILSAPGGGGWVIECSCCGVNMSDEDNETDATAEWNDRPVEDALRAAARDALDRVRTVATEREALRADVARLRGNTDALRDRAERMERERDVALGEVARLRSLLTEAVDRLPEHRPGRTLTDPETDAEALRLRLMAALGGDR